LSRKGESGIITSRQQGEVKTIGRMELGMKEQERYEVVKRLAEGGGNKERAALVPGCTRRSINRYIAGYKAEGRGCKILCVNSKKDRRDTKWKTGEDTRGSCQELCVNVSRINCGGCHFYCAIISSWE
jgi:hypothetical protein